MEDNIVWLPKAVEQIKIAVDNEMQAGVYEEALQKINLLLQHDYDSYEVHVQRITCLIKLKHYEEAEEFCELLLKEENEHYYDYFDYYMIVLYEQGKYSKMIDLIEQETESFPDNIGIKMNELKMLAMQLNDWTRQEWLHQFQLALNKEDIKKQYILLQKWQQHTLKDFPKRFYSLLEEPDIHPVIKTMMFTRLQNDRIGTTVAVRKLNRAGRKSPRNTSSMEQSPLYEKCVYDLLPLEQDNPTLYMLTKELLEQYVYVIYPLIPDENCAALLVEQMKRITKYQLGINERLDLNEYGEEILLCQQLYEHIMI